MNRASLDSICARVEVLLYAVESADQYGLIRSELVARG